MKVSGGCHCGAVRWEAELADAPVPALDCNCSVCSRTGFLHVMAPHSDFELITGRDALTSYRFGTGAAEHLFCKTCGVESFATGTAPTGDRMVAINVRCLDGFEIDAVTPVKFDGKSL